MPLCCTVARAVLRMPCCCVDCAAVLRMLCCVLSISGYIYSHATRCAAAVHACGEKDKQTVFNIWPGLKARLLPNYDETKVAPFKEVLFTIWASGDDRDVQVSSSMVSLPRRHPEQKGKRRLGRHWRRRDRQVGRV